MCLCVSGNSESGCVFALLFVVGNGKGKLRDICGKQ